MARPPSPSSPKPSLHPTPPSLFIQMSAVGSHMAFLHLLCQPSLRSVSTWWLTGGVSKEQLPTAAQGKLFNGTSGCGQLSFLGFPYSLDLCSPKHDPWTLLGPQESFRGSARSKLFS